ncbi:MAG: FHA domain-containing protein [Burkholderiaceae bacterium]|jgi:pSer/pThr/pTyr-binding forkhead associated (FHA) protein|nr:FHA domain-containing protein [Burkholderiaceae bacterium]
MPKLIVSVDDIIVKEVRLTKDRTTVGRKAHNDIVLDSRTVSGTHAAFMMRGAQVTLEDMGSTNGTYVNTLAVKKHVLQHDDVITIGNHQIRYHDLAGGTSAFPGWISGLGNTVPNSARPALETDRAAPPLPSPRIRVVNGPTAGRTAALTKPVTTVGKPGVSVAVITRHASGGFDLSMVEGGIAPTVNGVSVEAGPIRLKNRDRIAVGAIYLEFLET